MDKNTTCDFSERPCYNPHQTLKFVLLDTCNVLEIAIG